MINPKSGFASQTGYYHNKSGKLPKAIKGMISSNTSRVQSRAGSRQGQRIISSNTQNLKDNLKVNYLKNQKHIVAAASENRATSQMENNKSGFLNESSANITQSDIGINNHHSQS